MARAQRGVLEFEFPEQRVTFSESDGIADISPRKRYESHSLIEEFMITANVAAAETLEDFPCLYRIHNRPSPERLSELRRTLNALGFRLHGGQRPTAKDFSRLCREAGDSVINGLILRSQAKAVYSPNNCGHFGLNLRQYCHFTSPIRRYADLIVHRALISHLNLGVGGLPERAAASFNTIGNHISERERSATAAEQGALDRYTATLLADRLGECFEGYITTIGRFGCIVGINVGGAKGLLPRSSLGQGPSNLTQSCLTSGRRTFRLGERINVLLVEANPLSGGLVFELCEQR